MEGLGYHSALVCTHRELWSATALPPSSHEGGRNEDASAARVRRGGVHRHNCAQDARMHAPEQPGSARPQGRTNAFLGHSHFIVRGASGQLASSPYKMGIERAHKVT